MPLTPKLVVLMLSLSIFHLQLAPATDTQAEQSPSLNSHENWEHFLGQRRNGTSLEWPLKLDFSDQKPLKPSWALKRGEGYASPGIQWPYLVYPHRVNNEVIIECLNAGTGESYWQYKYKTAYRDRYGYNNGPRASPVIKGELVYTLGVEGELHCLKLKTGELQWEQSLKAFKPGATFFGFGHTPLIHGDKLIVNVGGARYVNAKTGKKGAAVCAFDLLTGKLRWHSGSQWGPSYATPIPFSWEENGKTITRILVLTGGESRPPHGGLLIIDPEDGRIEARFPWRSTSYESVNASSPVGLLLPYQGKAKVPHIFISATYKTGSLMLVRDKGVWQKRWDNKKIGAHFNTFIQDGETLYGFDGRNPPDARLVAMNAQTGDMRWERVFMWQDEIKRVDPRRKKANVVKRNNSYFRGTLIKLKENYLGLGESGTLAHLALTAKGPKELNRQKLFYATETWCAPVLSHQRLYICQNTIDMDQKLAPRLICYDLRP